MANTMKNGSEEKRLTQVPFIPVDVVKAICIDYFGFDPKYVEQLGSYTDKNYRLTNIDKVNGYSKQMSEDGYVLKITNSLDSSTPNLIEGQNAVLRHLKSRGLLVPELELTKDGNGLARVFIDYAASDNKETKGDIHAVRLFRYIPAQILREVPAKAGNFYKAGRLLASIHDALEDFRHPFFDQPPMYQWSLYNFCRLKDFLHAVDDDKSRQLVAEIIDAFEKTVMPLMPLLQTGQIHGDFNDQNILVSENGRGDFDVCGFLDVGATDRTCLIFDVATSLVYMKMTDSSVPFPDVGGHFLAGYTSRKTIPRREAHLIRLCMCARYCQSLVFGRYNYMLKPTPDNVHVLYTQEKGWPQLLKLWQSSDEDLLESWRRVLLSEYEIENAF